MKKVLAIIFVIALISAMILPAMALKDNTNLGTVPKTLTAPEMDGVKDPVYDQGLKIPVRNLITEVSKGGGGDMWLLWDNDYLYAYMTFNVTDAKDLVEVPDTYLEAWWDYTMVEFCLDFENQGESGANIKYMPGAHGEFASVCGWPPNDEAETAAVIQGVSKLTGNIWNVEFKISFAGSDNLLKEKDATFGSAVAAGKEIGFYAWLQEATSGGNAYYVATSALGVGDDIGVNTPPAYDYIVLGDNAVSAPEPEPAEAPEAVGGGDENVHVPAPAPAPAPSPVAAPITGDAIAVAIIVFSLTCAGLVAHSKKRRNKI